LTRQPPFPQTPGPDAARISDTRGRQEYEVSTKLCTTTIPMKTSPTILKKRTRFFPALLGAATASLLFIGSPAHAGYIVTLEQVGLNVVAAGSGALDLTGLTFDGSGGGSAGMQPKFVAFILTGPTSSLISDYAGVSGPTSFGTGASTSANSGTGALVGIFSSLARGDLVVPQGYVSGTALSDTSTYNNATFSTLGVTPGTYEWTWGIGLNQNFTLKIGPVGVPDAGSTIGLLILALAALFGASRALRVQSA
jgi:protein with PEP-CTERM/exosortase system signal